MSGVSVSSVLVPGLLVPLLSGRGLLLVVALILRRPCIRPILSARINTLLTR
jgi:hypothetical protein